MKNLNPMHIVAIAAVLLFVASSIPLIKSAPSLSFNLPGPFGYMQEVLSGAFGQLNGQTAAVTTSQQNGIQIEVTDSGSIYPMASGSDVAIDDTNLTPPDYIFIRGNEAANLIIDGSSAARISDLGGNDAFVMEGSGSVSAGDANDFDVMYIDGNFSDYTIEPTGNSEYKFNITNGTDTIVASWVEEIVFNDGVYEMRHGANRAQNFISQTRANPNEVDMGTYTFNTETRTVTLNDNGLNAPSAQAQGSGTFWQGEESGGSSEETTETTETTEETTETTETTEESDIPTVPLPDPITLDPRPAKPSFPSFDGKQWFVSDFFELDAAIENASDGDRIMLADGDYNIGLDATNYSGPSDQGGFKFEKSLSFEAVSGQPHIFNGAGQVVKGLITMNGDSNQYVLVDGIKFSGAYNTSRNGAGIRISGGNLLARDVLFENNENGILGGVKQVDKRGDTIVENSTFLNNGHGDGYSHAFYVGGNNVYITNSTFEGTKIGHHVKSTAYESTTVLNSTIIDTNRSDGASISFDITAGGDVWLEGNDVTKGSGADNRRFIHYAASRGDRVGEVVVTGNTFDGDAYTVYSPIVIDNNTDAVFKFVDNEVDGVDQDSLFSGLVHSQETVLDGTALPLSPYDAGAAYLSDQNNNAYLDDSAGYHQTTQPINGRGGDDVIVAGQNQNNYNTFFGGDGNDTLIGDTRYDNLHGGVGNDTLVGGDFSDVLGGGAGDDLLFGDNHSDSLYGGIGADVLLGGDGRDSLVGGAGNDILLSQAGNLERIAGGDGNDILIGGEGNDRFRGGAGNDVLYGGLGRDAILIGGADIDTMVYNLNYNQVKLTKGAVWKGPGAYSIDPVDPNNPPDELGSKYGESVAEVEYIQFRDGVFNTETDTFNAGAQRVNIDTILGYEAHYEAQRPDYSNVTANIKATTGQWLDGTANPILDPYAEQTGSSPEPTPEPDPAPEPVEEDPVEEDPEEEDPADPTPEDNLAAGTVMQTSGSVSLRATASTGGTLVTQLAAETLVKIIAGPTIVGEVDWYEVKRKGNVTGYLRLEDMSPVEQKEGRGQGATTRLHDTATDIDESGTDDDIEENTSTLVNKTKKDKDRFNTLKLNSSARITSFTNEEEVDVLADDQYSYPLGLFEFEAKVANGSTETVTIYLDTTYDTSDWIFRKYDGSEYVDISDQVTYDTQNVGSTPVTTISYDIEDNGPLDTDSRPGFIADPAGPAVTEGEDVEESSSGESSSSDDGDGSGGGSSGGGGGSSRSLSSSSLDPSYRFDNDISYLFQTQNEGLEEDIRNLSKFLNEYEGENLTIDDEYGTDDYRAVQRFQNKYSRAVLDVWDLADATGFVGITTRLKMNAILSNQTVQCPAFTEYNGGINGIMVSEEIGETQEVLRDLDMYSGPINDTWDSATNQAMIEFQETFHETMLDPWNITEGTGYKYKTTNKFLNYMMGCDTGSVYLEGVGNYQGIN